MQNITIIGRLTRDPERRVTRTGEELASINIAVDQEDKSTVFYAVSAFAGTAKSALKVLTKGWKVAVTGKLQMNQTNGKTYYNITAQQIEFISAPKRTTDQTDMTATPLNGFEDITSEDVPF